MLTQSAEDALSVLRCGITDGGQITLADVCRAVTDDTFKDGFIHRYAKLLHQIFTHGKHTLIGAVLLGEALFRKRAALIDIHDVHCAVTNIAEHIDTLEFTELVGNRRKALRENVCTDKINVVVNALKSEVGAVVLQEIFFEAVLLFAHPSQRKSRSKVNTGRGQLADVQLTGNGGKGENIVVAVCHFVGDKFLVFLTDEIISALIDKQIAFEGRLLVVGGNSRLETAVGGLDVAIAVVDTDDNGIGVVVHKIHRDSFLPLCGDTKMMMVLVVVKLTTTENIGLSESCQFGDFQFKLGVKSAKLAFFTFPNINEKSDFETFHIVVIVLVRGQNDHLPQVDDLSTCG